MVDQIGILESYDIFYDSDVLLASGTAYSMREMLSTYSVFQNYIIRHFYSLKVLETPRINKWTVANETFVREHWLYHYTPDAMKVLNMHETPQISDNVARFPFL